MKPGKLRVKNSKYQMLLNFNIVMMYFPVTAGNHIQARIYKRLLHILEKHCLHKITNKFVKRVRIIVRNKKFNLKILLRKTYFLTLDLSCCIKQLRVN